MAYASRSGRARTSSTNPQAFGVCDRCGRWYNFVNLRWQFDWRGAALQNLFIKVCNDCYDTPQEQLRAIVVPADPLPIVQARVEPFVADEAGFVTGPYGEPVGLNQGAVMPLSGTVRYGTKLSILSVTANGTNTIAATCSAPHGLATDDQVSVEGLVSSLACGFFSVVVTSATAFTYQTFSPIPAGALAQPTTNIITCLVGLPYGYTTIPQVGP